MASDNVFLDVLPNFDWALAEAGTKKLVGQFDTAAKDIAKSFGVEVGNSAKRSTEQISADVAKMSNNVERYTNAASQSYRNLVLAQGEVERSTLRVVEVSKKYGAESSQWSAALAKQEAATISLSSAQDAQAASMGRLTAAQATLKKGQTEHQAALDASTSKMAAFGTVANRVGAVSALAFGAALGESTKAAGDFEASQTRLVTTAGESQQALGQVSQGLLDMAGQVGESTSALSQGMYVVESAGFHGADGLKVMQAAAQGAKMENADLRDVTNAVTTALHDYHLPADQAATVTSKMITAVSQGKTTLGEFAAGLHSVQPLAGAAGISINDLYASLAQMTASGMSAEQATQNMADAIRHLQTPTAQMDKELSAIGIQSQDLSQHLGDRGLAGSLEMIQRAVMEHMGPAGKVLLDTFNESKQNADAASETFLHLKGRAQELAQGVLNGTVNLKDYRAQLKGLPLDQSGLANSWANLYQKATGFNGIVKAGGSDVQTYTSALAKATGDASSLNVMLQLTGENAGKTNQDIVALAATSANADGSVKDWAITQATFNQKLAEAKAGFGAMVVQLGADFLPTMTHVINAFADAGRYLEHHKVLLDTLVIGVGALGTAWLIAKAIMVFDTIITGLGKLTGAIHIVRDAQLETNGALAAAGPAAAEGAAGVDAAATAEVAAVGRVTTAAGVAKAALAGAASAAITLLGYQALVQPTDDFIKNHAPKPVADDLSKGEQLIPGDQALEPWKWPLWNALGNQVGDAFHGDFHKLQAPPPDPQTVVDEVNRRLEASGVGPNAPKPPGADPQATVDEVNQRLAASGVGPLAPTPTPPGAPPPGSAPTVDTTDLGGGDSGGSGGKKAKGPAGSKNDPLYMAPTPEMQSAFPNAAASPSDSGMTGVTGTSTLTGGFEFTPQGISKYFTTLLADLALGNPIGKSLAAKRGESQTNPLFVSDVNGQGGYYSENQLREALAGQRTQKANQTYQNDLAKYGADDPRTQTAYANLYSAQAAQQTRQMRDQATGGSASGIPVPAGAGAEAWRNTVEATVDKYGPQMGVTPANRQKWVDAIVSQIGTESSGNAGADNPNDPNGRGGIQHVAGLLQYLPSSYAASGGKLTGLPMMDPVGQIAGALFAPRNADGSPSGIGHGVGWGPVATPINAAAAAQTSAAYGPVSTGPASGARDGGSILEQLQSEFLGGGGEGPVFKRSPAPPVDPNAGNPNKGQTAASIAAENSPDALANLARMRSDPHWAPGQSATQAQPPGATPGTDLFAPGGVLSATQPPSALRPGYNGPHGGAGDRIRGARQTAAPVSSYKPPAVQGSSPGQQYGAGSNPGSGFTSSIGSTIGGLAAAAFPGVGQAAQQAGKLADRTIGYIGQLGGIAAGGIMETLLPGGLDNPLANPSKSWFGKLALGFAGAHSDTPSTAGTGAGSPTAKAADPQKAADPAASPKPGDVASGQGQGPPPGPGGQNAPLIGTQIIHTTNGVDGDKVGRDMNRYQGAMSR